MVRKIKLTYSFVAEVIQEFIQDKGSLFAAAISFFGLISLIPLLLLAVGVLGYIIGSYDTALQKVLSFAGNLIPVGADTLAENLRMLSRQSDLLSGIGLLGLLWVGIQVMVILQQVMNVALGSEKQMSFLRVRVMALGMVIVAGVLFALSIGITSMLTAVRHYQAELFGVGTQDLKVVWDFFAIIASAVVSILAFTFIYRFLPANHIGTTGPVIGGITAGLLFDVAKHVFRWYVTNYADFSRVYGSLGSVVILVVWIYYVSIIMVLGAEVASVYARREEISGE